MIHSPTTLHKEKNNFFPLKNSFILVAVPNLCGSWEIQTAPAFCLMTAKVNGNIIRSHTVFLKVAIW